MIANVKVLICMISKILSQLFKLMCHIIMILSYIHGYIDDKWDMQTHT